jgi:hypothetical protein
VLRSLKDAELSVLDDYQENNPSQHCHWEDARAVASEREAHAEDEDEDELGVMRWSSMRVLCVVSMCVLFYCVSGYVRICPDMSMSGYPPLGYPNGYPLSMWICPDISGHIRICPRGYIRICPDMSGYARSIPVVVSF